MNRTELIEAMIGTGVRNFRSYAAAERALDAVLEAIEEGLCSGERKVMISGFGTFKTVQRKAQRAKNPSTGEMLTVASSRRVHFSCGKKLRESANSVGRPVTKASS
jgi:DNA-binding protein HU-beta